MSDESYDIRPLIREMVPTYTYQAFRKMDKYKPDKAADNLVTIFAFNYKKELAIVL